MRRCDCFEARIYLICVCRVEGALGGVLSGVLRGALLHARGVQWLEVCVREPYAHGGTQHDRLPLGVPCVQHGGGGQRLPNVLQHLHGECVCSWR